MTSVEEKKPAIENDETEAVQHEEAKDDRPVKKIKTSEAEDATKKDLEPRSDSLLKPAAPADTVDPKPAEKKIFGSGFVNAKSPWAATATPASLFSGMTGSSTIFGQGSATLTFGSFAGSNYAVQNVFAKSSEDKRRAVAEIRQPLGFPLFRTPPFLGRRAKSQKKNEKQQEAAPPSGEEDEHTDFSTRGKLYLFDTEKKDWRERGVGVIKLNTAKAGTSHRLIMRSDGNMRLILNSKLFEGMVAELASEKSVRFMGIDPEHQRMQTYLLRTRAKDDSRNLLSEIKAKVSVTERPLSEILAAESQNMSQSAKEDKEKSEEAGGSGSGSGKDNGKEKPEGDAEEEGDDSDDNNDHEDD